MSTPKVSDFQTWQGKSLSKSQWDHNIQKTVDYFTDGTADIDVGNLNVTGAITATTLAGDGSQITGISGVNSKEYQMFVK